MRRVHRRRVGQGEQPAQRGVLGAGQRLGLLRAGQVGAGRRADQQRPAGEHRQHLRPVQQQVREVLSGVAGGSPGPQGQPAQVYLIAVGQSPVIESPAPGCRRENPRAVLGRQLRRPRTGSRHADGCQRRTLPSAGAAGRPPAPPAGPAAHRPRAPGHPPGPLGRPSSPGPRPPRARSAFRSLRISPRHHPAATGSPARFHSGNPSASRRARNPWRVSSRTASSAYTQ